MSKKILRGTIAGLFVALLVMIVSFRIFGLQDENKSVSFSDEGYSSQKIVGNGKLVTKTFSAQAFNEIKAGGKLDVTIKPGKTGSVVATMDENLFPYFKVEVKGGSLNIGRKSDVSLEYTKPIKIVITAPEKLQAIELGGKTTLQAKDLNTKDLMLALGGQSTAYLQGDIKNLQLNLGGKSEIHGKLADGEMVNVNSGGKGEVYLTGKVKKLQIKTAGKAMVSAGDLVAENVMVMGAGESDITVHATQTLSVVSAGKSSVKYYGNPAVSKTAVGDVQVEQLGSGKN